MAFNQLHLLLLTCAIFFVTNLCTAQVTQPRSDCQTTCGNLTNINFPFGTTPDCYLNSDYFIYCDNTTNTAFLQGGNIPVVDISLDGRMRILVYTAYRCFNNSGRRVDSNLFRLASYSVSNTMNLFTVVGCATLGMGQGHSISLDRNYSTGCITRCESTADVINGTCAGVGCCQASIPERVTDFNITARAAWNYSTVVRFNPCSYAFIVERGYYNFSSGDLMNMDWGEKRVVLNWGVGDSNCTVAQTNQATYACRATNSSCIDPTNTPGYNCNCTPGFEGNPYLIGGCQDIDECQTQNPCHDGYECENLFGGHRCFCPEGTEDDDGSCRDKDKNGPPLLQISLGVSIGFLLLVIIITFIFWVLQKRKLVKQKAHFFDQNGGFVLKQQLSKHQGCELARIFSAEDLKVATNNYDEARVIGQGGFGTVYKGVLSGDLEVAIKKSKITDRSQVEQFINEVVILSQINHRNVVRLLGCCLETEVPLLVYEFVKNGTLADHIHNKTRALSLSWKMRLKIAVEAAGALAYLHSETSTPIVHRDIKSTNILLDENYITKVSDFGASRLIPIDQSELATLVQGTFGYMDPEYFQSSQLTEKSDVYSFGVLLAELMTGEAAMSFAREEKYRTLAMYFISLVKEERLHEILDYNLTKDVSIDHIYQVANLVKMCLRLKGEERPTMRDLSIELEGLLNSITKHERVKKQVDNDETKHLLHEIVLSEGYDASDTSVVGYDSMRDQMIPFESVR